MTVRFIILMQWGRVGSNLLLNIIGQSRTATLANERFNTIRTLPEQLAWYETHFAAPAPGRTMVGTKENVLALADPGILADRFRADGLRIIRMRRDNLVKAAVSQMRAEAYAALTKERDGTARWAVRREEEPLGPVALDPEVLLRRIGHMSRARAALLDLFRPEEVLDVEYERLLADLPAVVADTRRHLGLPARPFDVPFRKATPDDLRAALSNYEEVAEAVRAAGHGAMLGN